MAINDLKEDFLVVKIINKKLKKKYNTVEKLGVLSGLSGIIIYQFLYARLVNSDNEINVGKNMIDVAIKKINEGYNMPSYCTGVSGFCWALQYLEEKKYIEFETDDFLSQMDVFFKDVMENEILNKNYDFLHGAIGYGVYFLKRYKNTKDENLKLRYIQNIEVIIKFLENNLIEDSKGVKWKSPQKSNIENTINIDLGLAHGVPSIISFLASLSEFNIFSIKVESMLRRAISFVLTNKYKTDKSISLFPTYVYHDLIKEVHTSRLAWCYGDLGIGLTILKAARVLKNRQLEKEAIRILKHSSKRKDLKENFVRDAGLCHGAFGISQIFGRLHKKTQYQEFLEASIYWKEEGLKMANYNNNDVSFNIWGERNWKDSFGLLEGISGIGLCLISHLTDFEDDWDECLLIS